MRTLISFDAIRVRKSISHLLVFVSFSVPPRSKITPQLLVFASLQHYTQLRRNSISQLLVVVTLQHCIHLLQPQAQKSSLNCSYSSLYNTVLTSCSPTFKNHSSIASIRLSTTLFSPLASPGSKIIPQLLVFISLQHCSPLLHP